MKIKYLPLLATIVLAIIFVSVTFKVNKNSNCNSLVIKLSKSNLCAIKIADNSLERSLGLSGVKSLSENEVALFIFDDTDRHGIWMKDMLLSIDVLWLNENKQIVWIEKNISPKSYPKVYYPEYPSKYVMEFAEGSIDRNGLVVGDKLYW